MNYVIVYPGTVLLFWDLSKKSVSHQLLFSGKSADVNGNTTTISAWRIFRSNLMNDNAAFSNFGSYTNWFFPILKRNYRQSCRKTVLRLSKMARDIQIRKTTIAFSLPKRVAISLQWRNWFWIRSSYSAKHHAAICSIHQSWVCNQTHKSSKWFLTISLWCDV